MNKKNKNCLITGFKVNNKQYLYDARANFLTEIEDELYTLLVDTDFTLYEKELNKLQENGVFCRGGLDKLVANEDEINELIEYCHEHTLPRKLILEVTEDCNLRCKYCFNTIGNTPRIHSKQNMSFTDAVKAIELYFNIYTTCFNRIPLEQRNDYLKIAPPNISWWGGEPLLNFELIKKTKDYFTNLPWNQWGITNENLVFSVVTNLTYLPEFILSFLIQNNVYMFISLDGGKEEHNLYRINKDG